MVKKLQYHQRKRLQAQGRCFKCQKKGHRASECTRNPVATPTELPVEILNLICEHLLFPHGDRYIPYKFALFDLRLTCRRINAKTFDLFASACFGRIWMGDSFRSFQRLSSISKAPALATHIRTLCFSHFEDMSQSTYEELDDEFDGENPEAKRLSQKERRSNAARKRRADQQSNDMSFFESSTLDGIMLADAMSRLRNVNEIYIDPPDRRPDRRPLRQKHGSNLPTATHTFTMVLACLKVAGICPRELRCGFVGRGLGDDALDVQALAVPNVVLRQLRDLTTLELSLRCTTSTYKNAATWSSHLAKFLKQVPLLSRLGLGLDDDFVGTSVMLDRVAKQIRLSHLKHLRFNGLECDGRSLQEFLRNHTHLHHLELKNVNFIGGATFQDVIQTMEDELASLTSVCFNQISQKSFRVLFKTLGDLEMTTLFIPLEPGEEPDFFADALFVNGPLRHQATIEEWDGVSNKLGKLREDVRVTGRTYHVRHGIERYGWFDTDEM